LKDIKQLQEKSLEITANETKEVDKLVEKEAERLKNLD